MIQIDSEYFTLKKENYHNLYDQKELTIILLDNNEQPIAKLSINDVSIKLAQNEFILKNYLENKIITKKLIKMNIIEKTGKFTIIGRTKCPICRLKSKKR